MGTVFGPRRTVASAITKIGKNPKYKPMIHASNMCCSFCICSFLQIQNFALFLKGRGVTMHDLFFYLTEFFLFVCSLNDWKSTSSLSCKASFHCCVGNIIPVFNDSAIYRSPETFARFQISIFLVQKQDLKNTNLGKVQNYTRMHDLSQGRIRFNRTTVGRTFWIFVL